MYKNSLERFSMTMLLWELYFWEIQTQIANCEIQISAVWILGSSVLAGLGKIWQETQVQKKTDVTSPINSLEDHY